MKKRIKTKVSKFHVERLREALEHLSFNNLGSKDEDIIGNLDVMRINNNVYVSITDNNNNIVMTCIEEGSENDD